MTPALEIVDRFVASRRAHWPTAMDFPRQEDRFAADRWLELGAERGVPVPELVVICATAVAETHDRLVARGHAAPERLNFHDKDVARAIRARTAPRPDLANTPPAPRGPGASPGRKEDANSWARRRIFGEPPQDDERTIIEGYGQ